ncbi:hypothetical protein BJV82DRAFT_650993 [Fennellomyces sp. T-0311]|nr:hypothetical protein BJV82DRAFT_650993 [Fennellomyces sp. T-0311]
MSTTAPYLYDIFEAYFRSAEDPSLARFVSAYVNTLATYHVQGDNIMKVWSTRYAKALAHYFRDVPEKDRPTINGTEVNWGELALAILNNGDQVANPQPSLSTASNSTVASNNTTISNSTTTSNSTGSTITLTPAFLDEFRKVHSNMNDDLKWGMASGRKVEDVLFNFGLKCQHEHAAHSFILDLGDLDLKKEFTSAEVRELKEHNAHPLPPCPNRLLEYLNEYSKLETIRELVAQTRKRTYDFETEFELDWAQYSMQSALRLFQGNFFPLTDQTEADIIRRIWLFVDTAFDNSEISVRTGEMESLASSNRRSGGRSAGDRKIHSHRTDFLFKHSNQEFGCSEVGKKDCGDSGTKEVHELGLKCTKMMKDQLVQLINDAPSSQKEDLVVVGLIMMGLKFRALVLDRPSTYICRSSRTAPLWFPSSERNVGSQLGALLALMAQVKYLKIATR